MKNLMTRILFLLVGITAGFCLLSCSDKDDDDNIHVCWPVYGYYVDCEGSNVEAVKKMMTGVWENKTKVKFTGKTKTKETDIAKIEITADERLILTKTDGSTKDYRIVKWESDKIETDGRLSLTLKKARIHPIDDNPTTIIENGIVVKIKSSENIIFYRTITKDEFSDYIVSLKNKYGVFYLTVYDLYFNSDIPVLPEP